MVFQRFLRHINSFCASYFIFVNSLRSCVSCFSSIKSFKKTHTHTRTLSFTRTHTHTHTLIHTHTHTHTHTYTHTGTYTHTHTNTVRKLCRYLHHLVSL